MSVIHKNRIDETFATLKAKGQKALIPFITVGDPALDVTVRLLLGLEQAGANVIELGIPYSDPLADGPVIERASGRALEGGTTIESGLEAARRARDAGAQIPYVLFTYYNPVLQYGIDNLFKAIHDADISGMIIPDLPYEENQLVLETADRYGVHLIPLVAPTSKERVQRIVSTGRGFIYCVSSMGVTGTREAFDDHVTDFLDDVRAVSHLPIAVGFGILTPAHVQTFAPHCDGVIVGSAIVKQIEAALPLLRHPQTVEDGVLQICEFVRQLKA